MADPTNVVPESRRPALGEWFNEAAFIALGKARVCLPGRVETYDPATQLASVKPLLQSLKRNANGSTEPASLPVVNGVPVLMPQGGGRQIKLPVAKNDVVLLVFADRSLDIWKSKGGEVDPVDLRQHHLSDAVAIPCFRDPAAAAPEATIEIKADGSVLLGPGATKAVARVGDATQGHAHSVVFALAAGATPVTGTITVQSNTDTIAQGSSKVKAVD
jgi:hypothetical protein